MVLDNVSMKLSKIPRQYHNSFRSEDFLLRSVFVRLHPVRNDVGNVFDIPFDHRHHGVILRIHHRRPLDIPQEHEEIGIRFSGELFPERIVQATLFFHVVLFSGCGVLFEILREIGCDFIIRRPVFQIITAGPALDSLRPLLFRHLIFCFIYGNDLVMIKIKLDFIQIFAFYEIRDTDPDLFCAIIRILFRERLFCLYAWVSEDCRSLLHIGSYPQCPLKLYFVKRRFQERMDGTFGRTIRESPIVPADGKLTCLDTAIISIAITTSYTELVFFRIGTIVSRNERKCHGHRHCRRKRFRVRSRRLRAQDRAGRPDRHLLGGAFPALPPSGPAGSDLCRRS